MIRAITGRGTWVWSFRCGKPIAVLLGLLTLSARSALAEDEIQHVNVGGYLSVSVSQAPQAFDAGYSFYTAAWPLVAKYPGHEYQSGLFGTWLGAHYDGPGPNNLYTDIEGGLGWWNDTSFPTLTPKFLMGGVAPNFCAIANGPAHGWGDMGLYGIAQLSPHLLFPLDGLNLRQGTCGQLFGYGYLNLPLIPAQTTTDGANVPTGGNCWTLFLSTRNFKGPVAFFTPHFWSHTTVKSPQWAGQLLDSRPCQANRPVSMETAYIPAAVSENAVIGSYLRTALTQFPVDAENDSIVMHRLTVYSKDALWNDVNKWFDGGSAPSGSIDTRGALVQQVSDGGAGWKIWPPKKGHEAVPLAWNKFAEPYSPDPTTFGYRWDKASVKQFNSPAGRVIRLPEYFRLDSDTANNPQWTPVDARTVPASTKLSNLKFDTPTEPAPQACAVALDADPSWKTPGPTAGPFKAHLGDGSVVTYYWYRFVDQPAIVNSGLTPTQREQLQARAVKIHRNWPKSREYFAPPTVGKLCDLDPALLVTPPAGLEAGYVPIATRQEMQP